jgi:putative protease
MKIEGRGRSAEYVDTVVKTYKSALKDIETWAYSPEKIKEYYTKLETVYNRQLSKGNYYLGKELGDYSDAHGSKATTEKETIWRVTHFYPKVSVAEVIIDSSSIKAGQTVLIIGASTGVIEFIPEWLYIDGIKVEEAKKGQTLTIKVPERVRQNDKFSIVKSRTTLQQSTVSCD